MIGDAWSTPLSVNLFIYLLRFAAAEPSTTWVMRARLESLLRDYTAQYPSLAGTEVDAEFGAFLRGDFFSETAAKSLRPPRLQ